MLEGFEPETNETDRRFYYEVTGHQLVEGEFVNDDTSDEDWERF